MPPTTKRQLIDIKLGGQLDAHVRRLRTAGWSWRGVASWVAAASGVSVTDVTLAEWYTDLTTDAGTEAS